MPEASAGKRLAGDARLLEEAVRAAGRAALAYYGHAQQTWQKANESPVSEADYAADRVLRDRLMQARPGYGWLSEESARVTGDPAWVVDPVDGTSAFLRHSPEWTVSAALVASGRPVAAAVYNPAEELFFCAAEGAGARLNGQAIQTADRAGIEGARLLAERRVIDAKRWRTPWPSVETRSVNSIAYRLCLVACGRFDATISASAKSDWDIAAADLIVHEAGGRVTAFNGSVFVYNRPATRQPDVVAAGAGLHARLIAHIAASDRRRGADAPTGGR